MSYNSSTGIISAPVSIDDVKTALGESSNDLATLCTSSNINMWSKYKPVHNNIAFPNNEVAASKSTWYTNSSRDWWLGAANKPAIEIPLCETFDAIKAAYWIHNKPTGGSSSPYRLSDFIGYNTYDKGYLIAPIRPQYAGTSGPLSFNSPCNVGIYSGDKATNYENVITLDDILEILKSKANYIYPGVYLYNVTRKIGYMYTSNKAIDDDTYDYDTALAYFTIDWANRTITESSWTDTISLNIESTKDDVVQICLLLATANYKNSDSFHPAFPISCFSSDGFPTYMQYTLTETYTITTIPCSCTISSISFSDTNDTEETLFFYNHSDAFTVVSDSYIYGELDFRVTFNRTLNDVYMYLVAETTWELDSGGYATSTVTSDNCYFSSIKNGEELLFNRNRPVFKYWTNSDDVSITTNDSTSTLYGVPILDTWNSRPVGATPIKTDYKLVITKYDVIVNGTKYVYSFSLTNDGIVYTYEY